MAREGVEMEGTVIDCLPGAKFKVQVESGGNIITSTCTISGKMRTRAPDLKILLGDRVRVLLGLHDLSMGRIEWVLRKRPGE